MMLRLTLIALMFVVAIPALALDMTAAQREACKADYDKYCKGTMRGGGVVACLNKQHDSLSVACKKVVNEQKK
jgi:hypothetical protein